MKASCAPAGENPPAKTPPVPPLEGKNAGTKTSPVPRIAGPAAVPSRLLRGFHLDDAAVGRGDLLSVRRQVHPVIPRGDTGTDRNIGRQRLRIGTGKVLEYNARFIHVNLERRGKILRKITSPDP